MRQNEVLSVLGTRVREARAAKGWSQERLAEAAGLHRTYIGGIERGERNVSILNIAKIARVLGKTPADLVSERVP
jgi:transcriptional regulator with XRE-family HTH domain